MKITRKNYKLIKRTSFIALTAAIAINTFKLENIEKVINFNRGKTIECTSDSITFINRELYDYLNNKYEIKNNVDFYLRHLSSIDLNKTFLDDDLSDLQYFSNLKYLTIKNNKVDLSILANLKNLKSVTLINCEITNSFNLPSNIENLTLEKVNSLDGLKIPANVRELNLNNVKTPELSFSSFDNLNDFYLSGNLPFDASILKYFTSLKRLTLLECPNIYNASSLKEISSYPEITLDDFAPIWLDSDTLSQINCELDEATTEEISYLDALTGRMNLNQNSVVKEQQIIKYVLEHLTYDPLVLNKSDASYNLSKFYLKNPIHYAVGEDCGIDITYASYFQALANRLGLKSYVVNKDDEYLIQLENKALNLSKMDLKESGVVMLKDQYKLNTKTSFDFRQNLSPDETLIISFDNQDIIISLETYITLLILINTILKIFFPKKDIIEDEKTYKKINN